MGKISKLISVPFIWLIKFYRYFFSPMLGAHCRFTPSCSVYCCEAFENFGFWIGGALCMRRLVRCHPFHPGGVDLLPLKKNQ